LHNIFEQKEIDYRIRINLSLNKKKSNKELKKEILETKKAYKNLYSSDSLDLNCANNNSNMNSSLNIIKINLSSLETGKCGLKE
jgi:hypothetical protein